MNPLAFTALSVRVSALLSKTTHCCSYTFINFALDNKEAIQLLDGLAERFKKETMTGHALPISYILAKAEAAQFYLKESQADTERVHTARDYIDECIELVESMAVSPPASIQASVYRISALYDKFSMNFSAFYRHTFLYLACLPVESMSVASEKNLEIAHDLCLAALLADDIYNFGELLQHPILNLLRGTKFEFLVSIISAFNAGELQIFVSEAAPLVQAVKGHPALAAHFAFLQEKLCLMSLAHLLFVQIKNDRRVTFGVISGATKVPLDQVEFLLIKAVSCKIIRGIIDQVDGSITVTWIQPRTLDQSQIGELLSAVEAWNGKVGETLSMVQEMRARGAFNEATTTII